MKKIYKLKIFVSIILLGIIFFISVIIKREKNIDEKISKNIKETVEKTSTSPKEEQISTNQAQIVEKEQINSEYKGYKTSAKLYIPKINLETYVIENYSKEALLTSVTKFYGGKANEVGNFCIAGHNYGNENMASHTPTHPLLFFF